jgi:transposase
MAERTYQELNRAYEDVVEENERLRRQKEELEKENQRLRELLEEARRRAKRQAAPFSKGKPKSDPKKPGRKPGKKYGRRGRRPAPTPSQIDETHEAELPAACPHCASVDVQQTGVEKQYQVEIPRRPIHRQFNVHVGHCCSCGRRVQGHHPLQTSDALGAAASQLGPNLQAAIIELNKVAGLSYGKVQSSVETLFGIQIHRSTACRVVLRGADRLRSLYEKIEGTLAFQPWVSLDETGWRVGGHKAWLHVLTSEALTYYKIDRGRGADVAASVLGWDYAGTMIHDGWAPYDRFNEADHQQCLAHLLNRCVERIETATRGAIRFPRQVKAVLQDGLNLRDRHESGEVSIHGLAVATGRLQSRLDRLIGCYKADPDNERLAAHLFNHQDDVFTFLRVPGIDATNWRGEQAIRPAVVNRKVWGGNRTDRGAEAQSILMSVLRTCVQHGRNTITFVSDWLRGQRTSLDAVPLGP